MSVGCLGAMMLDAATTDKLLTLASQYLRLSPSASDSRKFNLGGYSVAAAYHGCMKREIVSHTWS